MVLNLFQSSSILELISVLCIQDEIVSLNCALVSEPREVGKSRFWQAQTVQQCGSLFRTRAHSRISFRWQPRLKRSFSDCVCCSLSEAGDVFSPSSEVRLSADIFLPPTFDTLCSTVQFEASYGDHSFTSRPRTSRVQLTNH